MQVIPYKSANEMVLAVVSGQVAATIADAGPVSPQVKAGTVRALAVTAPKRMDGFPDVPTMKEAGADVDAMLWSGIFAPKATPPAIVKKLEAEFMRIAKLPDVVSRLKADRHRCGRHLERRVREDPSIRHHPLGRCRKISQYQDRAVS